MVHNRKPCVCLFWYKQNQIGGFDEHEHSLSKQTHNIKTHLKLFIR